MIKDKALAQPEQEPVAKVCHDLDGHIGWNPNLKQLPNEGTPLYTSPPQRKPEQEPVAWMFQHEETGRMMFVETQQLEGGFEKGNPRLKKIGPVYTSPPQRKPLSDEEIDELSHSMVRGDKSVNWLCRAIERKHGIKENS